MKMSSLTGIRIGDHFVFCIVKQLLIEAGIARAFFNFATCGGEKKVEFAKYIILIGINRIGWKH